MEGLVAAYADRGYAAMLKEDPHVYSASAKHPLADQMILIVLEIEIGKRTLMMERGPLPPEAAYKSAATAEGRWVGRKEQRLPCLVEVRKGYQNPFLHSSRSGSVHVRLRN